MQKAKTNIGNKINFVRETIKARKLGEAMNQESYQKLFRPLPTGLDDIKKINLLNLLGDSLRIKDGK